MKTHLALCLIGSLCCCCATAQADQKADTLLKDMKEAYRSAQTLTAQSVTNVGAGKDSNQQTITYRLQKPGQAVVITTGKYVSGSAFVTSVYSDGETLWVYDKEVNQYTKQASSLPLLALSSNKSVRCSSCLTVSKGPMGVFTFTTRYLGTRSVGGVACQVIEVDVSHPVVNKRQLYIGPDKLLRRIVSYSKTKQGEVTNSDTLITNIQINKTLPASLFVFTPPKDAKLTDAPFAK